MEFTEFKKALQNRFAEITKDATHLFEVAVDKDELWNLYLDSFPAGTNEIYRERREYGCSCCRHFIKAIGNAVVIKNNTVYSIWDIAIDDPAFQTVANAMANYIEPMRLRMCMSAKRRKSAQTKTMNSLTMERLTPMSISIWNCRTSLFSTSGVLQATSKEHSEIQETCSSGHWMKSQKKVL